MYVWSKKEKEKKKWQVKEETREHKCIQTNGRCYSSQPFHSIIFERNSDEKAATTAISYVCVFIFCAFLFFLSISFTFYLGFIVLDLVLVRHLLIFLGTFFWLFLFKWAICIECECVFFCCCCYIEIHAVIWAQKA